MNWPLILTIRTANRLSPEKILASELPKQPSAFHAQRNLQFSYNNYILQLDYLVFLYTIGRML